MRILKILARNIDKYYENNFEVTFIAKDRVMPGDNLKNVYGSIYLQNLISLVGVNASGKTRSLKLIEFILTILFDKKGLNEQNVPYGVVDGTEFVVHFIYENKIYEWTAIINVQEDNGKKKYSYCEEELKEKYISSIKNRKDIFDFSKVINIQKRSELPVEILEMMKDDSSITIRIGKNQKDIVHSLTGITNLNILLPPIGNIPLEIVNLFDQSIEKLDCSSDEKDLKCLLKFKEDQKEYKLNNAGEFNNLLSSGTIKGNCVFVSAMIALFRGGYLIIDEIENHFHKELVKLLLSLFKSQTTNPNGAVIIFSTHYAEILDTVDRKDNIYILNKVRNDIKISNYSDYIKRNDLKKSDVLLSGIIEGTVPKYENVKAFKEFLCRSLLKKKE